MINGGSERVDPCSRLFRPVEESAKERGRVESWPVVERRMDQSNR